MPNQDATPFARTLRTLATDRFVRPSIAMAVAITLIAAWVAWFVRAEVELVAVSLDARLAVERSVHPIEALVTGEIERSELVLGRTVAAGDVLVVLRGEQDRLRLDEQRGRAEALEIQLNALEREIAARDAARDGARRSASAEVRAANIAARTQELVADLADEELARLVRLGEQGGVSEFDLSRARLEAERAHSAVAEDVVARERLGIDHEIADAERGAAVQALERERGRLEGELAGARAAVSAIEADLARRTITAPVAGEVAEVTELGAGAVVERGRRLGSIVSSGTLVVVAEFAPGAAIGRVVPGGLARVELAGFPRSEYGDLAAVVTSVASEASAGTVRVELALVAPERARVPLQHGLPATVAVVVDDVSPAELVLRSAGRPAVSAPAPVQR